VRVKGKNWWEWVFVSTLAVLHVIKPGRGQAAASALFGAIQPAVWVSDMLGSQRGHARLWQVCLAHYADLPVMPTTAWKPAPEAAIAGIIRAPEGRREVCQAAGSDPAWCLPGWFSPARVL
jgi:hypothetical protein